MERQVFQADFMPSPCPARAGWPSRCNGERTTRSAGLARSLARQWPEALLLRDTQGEEVGEWRKSPALPGLARIEAPKTLPSAFGVLFNETPHKVKKKEENIGSFCHFPTQASPGGQARAEADFILIMGPLRPKTAPKRRSPVLISSSCHHSAGIFILPFPHPAIVR